MSAGDGACVRLLCFRDPPCRVGQITIVGLRKTDRQRSEAIRDWSRFTGDYFLIPKIRISHILSAQGTGPQDAPIGRLRTESAAPKYRKGRMNVRLDFRRRMPGSPSQLVTVLVCTACDTPGGVEAPGWSLPVLIAHLGSVFCHTLLKRPPLPQNGTKKDSRFRPAQTKRSPEIPAGQMRSAPVHAKNGGNVNGSYCRC